MSYTSGLSRSLHLKPNVWFSISIAAGVLLAVLLLFQCARTYLYVGRVLIPREAEREAERKAGSVSAAARTGNLHDPHDLTPILTEMVHEAPEQIAWMRIMNQDAEVLAEAGVPLRAAAVPQGWWERAEKHESLGTIVEGPKGPVCAVRVPFRMPRPRLPGLRQAGPPPGGPAPDGVPPPVPGVGPPPDRRAGALVLEVGVYLLGASQTFSGLLDNLIVGILAAIALLAAMAVIGFRMGNYLRGKYLEKEMELARKVQGDLLPTAAAVSPAVEFAAAAIAADQVGGDFYDIFETDAGLVSIVLGDVSGKGIPAALLVSVIHGAIRSSILTGSAQHEASCERINRMLCERTARERFATLFWANYEPLSATLRYVNAGHAPPLLLRAQGGIEKLDEGGPVLGILPSARYTCGKVQVRPGDLLVLYSDGISEAASASEEEFGDERVLRIVTERGASAPKEICDQIMHQVAAFASTQKPQDDRTLLIVRFVEARAAMTA